MMRNFGIGFLVFCFVFSSVNLGLAAQVVEVPPIIVEPSYNLSEINEQMLEQDRINRDQELAIKGLAEQNQSLAQTAQQDSTLDQINQTMLNYRNALLERDRARIMANGLRASRYDDLIALTEDVDGMKGVGPTLQLKSDLIEQKYKILMDLKNEMVVLNKKLEEEALHKHSENINQEQAQKILFLTQRLAELDQRVSRYDEILAEKDQQIAQLKFSLAGARKEAAGKDIQLGQLRLQLSQTQTQVGLLKSELENRIARENNQDQESSAQKAQVDQLKMQLSQKQAQVDLLKSELENKITEENNQGQEASAKDEMVKQQRDQITVLKAQAQELSSKEELMQSQADQMAKELGLYKDQGTAYASLQAEFMALKNKISSQAVDLKIKNESIRWLNQVLAVTKNKAEYYRLTAQQDRMTMRQVQDAVLKVKDDFTRHFKDYDQFENAIISLKEQVGRMGGLLSQKQEQVELLTQSQQELKAQLREKENQIDDRISLAKHLIALQQQEASLLQEKGSLEASQNDLFDRHFLDLEKKIKGLAANHQLQAMDLQSRMEELREELELKEQQGKSLRTELENKIADEKNQSVLASQIQDLEAQLQDKENQISAMKTEIQSGRETQDQTDTLRQQLADQQNKADVLKQELDSKNAQSDKMTLMISDYQQKLESKDNAYNEELQQVLDSKNAQAQMEGQIVDLNARLQQKEAQIVEIKKNLYDLQQSMGARDRESQTHDLSLSIMQQKMLDGKINEYQDKINGLQATNDRQAGQVAKLKADLALARQQLVGGMPSSDEIDFLRAGLNKAALQLKQKDAMLLQIKANADEYEKEFKEQTQEFLSLKEQLQNALDKISRKDEDLTYKNMEIIRLKERSHNLGNGDLQNQVRVLTRKLEAAEKRLRSKTYGGGKAGILEGQLEDANEQIKELHAQLNEFILPAKSDALREKLKQALDKVDQQGHMINVLVQKLQDAGKSVNLSQL